MSGLYTRSSPLWQDGWIEGVSVFFWSGGAYSPSHFLPLLKLARGRRHNGTFPVVASNGEVGVRVGSSSGTVTG